MDLLIPGGEGAVKEGEDERGRFGLQRRDCSERREDRWATGGKEREDRFLTGAALFGIERQWELGLVVVGFDSDFGDGELFGEHV